MTSRSIAEYAAAVRARYRTGTRREKGTLLDAFCSTTGYHRKAAVRLLNAVAAPSAAPSAAPTSRRGRPPVYDAAVDAALATVWEASDRLCGKRLAPFLPELVPLLVRHGELTVADTVQTALIGLSAATIDRRMAATRRRGHRPAGHAAASATLRAQVPVRTFGEWADVRPGAVQADLVAHSGPSSTGVFLTTLLVIDVATGWTDMEALWGKGQIRVGSGLHRIRERLPVPLRELHTDNGSEFINHLLVPWCQRKDIRLTRGRPYRKNDQAWVEQRNWLVVRRLVGYDRYSSHAAHAQLGRVYDVARIYANFFQPLSKLIDKEREGARVRKRYDEARTPYQRLLAAGVLSQTHQDGLARLYHRLNPVALRTQLHAALSDLWALAEGVPAAAGTPSPTRLR